MLEKLYGEEHIDLDADSEEEEQREPSEYDFDQEPREAFRDVILRRKDFTFGFFTYALI